MVKPDIKRNYYADLELPNDAGLDEIKKQYRKLALKYHPDRNPGKEAEIAPKFQIIQAAHEVLEDPTTKNRYDTDRRKAGLVPTYGARTAPSAARPPNPYAASMPRDFPPPPKRNPTATGSTRGAPPSFAGTWSANGADRFTNFPKGPAPTSKKDRADPAQAYSAWQHMKPGQGSAQQQQQQQQQPPQMPRPQPKGAFGTSPTRPRPAPPPRPDTSYPTEEEIRAGTNYRQAPSRPFNSWADFNSQNAGKPGVARSNTTKTPKKSGFDPMAGGDEGQARSTANYSSSRARTRSDESRQYPPPPPPPPPTPPRFPAETHQTSHNASDKPDAPYAEGIRVKTPYSSHIGQQKYASSDNLQRSNSARDIPRARQTTANTPPKHNKSNGTARRPFVVEESSDDSDSDQISADSTPEAAQPASNQSRDKSRFVDPFFGRPKRTPIPPSSRTASPFKQSSFESVTSTNFSGSNRADLGDTASFATSQSNASNAAPPPEPQAQHQQDRQPSEEAKDTIFTFPLNPDTFASGTNNAKAKREESINTTFAPDQWAGKFSANNIFAAAAQPTAHKPPPPVRKSSKILRAQANGASAHPATPADGPFAQYTGGLPRDIPPPPPSPPQNPVKFNADVWAETMKDPTWVFQPDAIRADPLLSSTSRSSSRTARKMSGKVPVKIPATVPKVATAVAVEDESLQAQTAQADAELLQQQQGSGASTNDPMDVDMEGTSPGPSPGTTGTPVNDFTATSEQKQEPKFIQVDRSSMHQSQSSAPKLDDLAENLPGMSSTGEGLADLKDISSTLPFTSKPSTRLPTKSYAPQTLELPNVPRVPEAPTKLSITAWSQYCERFSRYLSRYYDYDSKMVAHFSSRRQQAGELIFRGVKELESVGAELWMSYKRGVEEDERARMHWNVGTEKHLEAVKEFEAVRQRVKILSEGPGLADV